MLSHILLDVLIASSDIGSYSSIILVINFFDFERPPTHFHEPFHWQNLLPPVFVHVLLAKLRFLTENGIGQATVL